MSKSKTLIVVLILSILFLFFADLRGTRILAAPDPSEVEKIKLAAPLHLIGRVTTDELHQDLTEEKGSPYQIRKMNIKVTQLLKVPEEIDKFVDIEVYYTYIPSWKNMYAGGERMDIAVHDTIEIWLEKGEFGWESALWGNTVEHIEYAEDREEPIPEPFLHKLKNKMSSIWSGYKSIIVFIGLVLTTIIIILQVLKKQRQ